MLRLRLSKLCWVVVAACLLGSGAERVSGADVSVGAVGTYLDTEDLGKAYGGGVRLKYDLIEYVGMDFRASMVRLQDPSINMFPLEANLMLQFPVGNTVLPYGGFGVGYYFFDGGDFSLKDRVGYGPLAGLELRLTRDVALFGEARWLFLEPDVSGVPGVDKARLDGFGINAGIMLLF
jgi:opacity protein-like surface antigen